MEVSMNIKNRKMAATLAVIVILVLSQCDESGDTDFGSGGGSDIESMMSGIRKSGNYFYGSQYNIFYIDYTDADY